MYTIPSGLALLALTFAVATASHAQSPLHDCADQFIAGTVANAPTIRSSPPEKPFATNVHLCYRDDDASFFALEYWPEAFAPRWAAYKLSPENYGRNGCKTYTRNKANCYIKAESWAEFQTCTKSGDRFHSDHMLTGDKLSRNAFSNTGHDRKRSTNHVVAEVYP